MTAKISSLVLCFAFVTGMIAIASPNAYSTTSINCAASLDGGQEVPPVNSPGSGSATMDFDQSASELSWSIEFSNLTGNASAAHFHGPAAEGSNAGIAIDIGGASGLVSPMEGSAVLTEEQAGWLLDGLLYINIHTHANPSGEIRGQVACDEPAPGEEPSTAALTIGDQEYDIQYVINGGTVNELTAVPEVQTLITSISATSAGNITIWLPTEVMDAENNFTVIIDDQAAAVEELEPTSSARVIRVGFENGAQQISITGTTMVPEFGALAMLVVAAAIVGAIVAASRFRMQKI